MGTRGGPYYKWKYMHCGHGKIRKYKRVHANLVIAEMHCLNLQIDRPELKFSVYKCNWTDDYRDREIAPDHYHVGRKTD